VACGLAAGIKLAGFFFAPAVGLLLLAGILQKKLTWPQAVLKGVVFIVLLTVTLFITNPFLVNSGARQELVNIQSEKTQLFAQGYEDPNPDYQRGPQFWEWTLSTWFAQPWLLAFLSLALIAGCFLGPERLLNRVILAWCIPYSVYLLWFVAVKPDQYWLPVMLPLYSAALNLLASLPEWLRGRAISLTWSRALQAVVILVLVGHLGWNIARPFSGAIVRIQEGLAVENQQP
jgi:hypothetical protein